MLKDCVIVLGEVDALSRPFALLQTYVNNNPANTPWQDIEAVLFAFRAMGAEVSNGEAQILPQV